MGKNLVGTPPYTSAAGPFSMEPDGCRVTLLSGRGCVLQCSEALGIQEVLRQAEDTEMPNGHGRLWINTYENTILSGMNIHVKPAILGVNRRGTIGFDPSQKMSVFFLRIGSIF